MFIHAGASLHDREASPTKRVASPSQQEPPLQPRNRPVPLLRSALRPLGDNRSATNTHGKHARFSLHSDSDSGRRSFTEPLLPTFPSASASAPPISALPLASPTSLPPTSPPLRPSHRRLLSDTIMSKDLASRLREPAATTSKRSSAAPSITSDEESLADSDVTDFTIDSSTRRPRRKKLPRKGTTYSLAHPPPRRLTRQRTLIQFRPSTLLQLQKVNARRPVPAFDVLPSSTISTAFLLPGLAKRMSRIRRSKPELGSDDLVIANSEDYESGLPSHRKDLGKLEHRDLMGVVSPLPEFGDDAAEIILGDGSVWSTAPLLKGSYEFKCRDSCGNERTARWVKKQVKPARMSSEIPPSPASTSSEPKWTFSILDPLTRRHPVMGVLTSRELTVYDTYSAVSTSSGRYPPTKPFTNIPSAGEPPMSKPKPERATLDVPEEYKQLMVVTASWISLRLKGWPDFANPTFRRNSMHCRNASIESAGAAERRRSCPVTYHEPNAASRPSSLRSPRVSDERPHPDIPKRHMSTGAAYMRRRRMEKESMAESNTMKENMPLDKGEPSHPVVRTKGLGGQEEKTATCRIKVRRLTQRLFRRDGHGKEDPARLKL